MSRGASDPFDVPADRIAAFAEFRGRITQEIFERILDDDNNAPISGLSLTLRREGREADFREFVETGELSFSIRRDDIPELYTFRRVVAARFRVEVPGAATSNGELLVELTQSGSSTLWDGDDHPHDFVHRSATADVVFVLATGQIRTHRDFATQPLRAEPFAVGVGLVSSWRLVVPKRRANPGLDLSGVSEIHLHFEGFRGPRIAARRAPVAQEGTVP